MIQDNKTSLLKFTSIYWNFAVEPCFFQKTKTKLWLTITQEIRETGSFLCQAYCIT